MKNATFALLLALLLLSACSTRVSEHSVGTDKTTNLTSELEKNPSEDSTKIQENNSESKNTKLTEREAEEIVRKFLELSPDTKSVVEFDHMEDGKFSIHVYDFVGDENEEGHTATRGWYLVDPNTKEVTSLF